MGRKMFTLLLTSMILGLAAGPNPVNAAGLSATPVAAEDTVSFKENTLQFTYDPAADILLNQDTLDAVAKTLNSSAAEKKELESIVEDGNGMIFPMVKNEADVHYAVRYGMIDGIMSSSDNMRAGIVPNCTLDQFVKTTLKGTEMAGYSLATDSIICQRYNTDIKDGDTSATLYVTAYEGDLIYFLVCWDPGYEETGLEYGERIISQFTDPAKIDAAKAKRTYDLGKVTVYQNEDAYDTITVSNADNQRALERQGLSLAKADLYVKSSKYALHAVPVGDTIGKSRVLLRVNIKNPRYQNIGDFRNLTLLEQQVFAKDMVSTFIGNDGDYELFKTKDAVYMVFECKSAMGDYEKRYATIKDGGMVYFFMALKDDVTEEERTIANDELISMITTAEWK